MLKQLLLTAMASIAVVAVSAQIKINIDIDPNEPIISDMPVKVANNGRVLSKKGMALIFPKDLDGITFPNDRDTMIVTLKPEAIKLLDANAKANYEPVGKSAKKSKKDGKNAPKKTDASAEQKVVKATTIRKSDGNVVNEVTNPKNKQ